MFWLTTTMLFSWLRLSWTPLDLVLLVAFVVLLALTEYRPIWLRVQKNRKKVKVKNRLTIKDIPGPRPSIPILGTRWIFSPVGPYRLNKIHEAYQDMFRQYGKVVKEEVLWNYPVISVFDRSSIEEVLTHHSKYPLRPPTEVTVYYRRSRPDRYTNLGIVNEQGETWHNLRSILTAELTSTKTVMRFLPEQNAVTEDFLSLLKMTRNEKNEVHSFEEFTNRMGLEVTCTLILGRRMGFLNNDVDELAAKLAAAVKVHFCASRDTFYGLPFWKAFPTKAYKQFVQSEEVIYEIISDLLEKSLKEENETCQTSDVQSVFISILRAKGLDTRDKKAAIIDFIAAGIQTFGNTLVFLIYLVAKHQEVQQKLYEEVSHLVPKGSSVTTEALKNASYLRACITEAFRVLPTAPCVARILENEMDICGYRLSPGAVVLCHTWLASMQEANFESATAYKPERWLTEGSRRSNYLVVPFGCGRRMCPGKRFMEQNLQIVLAKAETFDQGSSCLPLEYYCTVIIVFKTVFMKRDGVGLDVSGKGLKLNFGCTFQLVAEQLLSRGNLADAVLRANVEGHFEGPRAMAPLGALVLFLFLCCLCRRQTELISKRCSGNLKWT